MGYVESFEIAAASESGNKSSRTRKYFLSCNQMTAEEMYEWLGTDNAKLFEGEGNESSPNWEGGDTPIPLVYDERPLSDLSYKLLRDIEPNWYEVTATWNFPSGGSGGGSQDNPLDPQLNVINGFSLNLGVTAEHAQLSLETKQSIPRQGSVAPDYEQYVNVSESEGQVKYDGYDRLVPTMDFTISIMVPANVFDVTRRVRLASFIGKLNSELFLGYPVESVMFSGANVSIDESIPFGTDVVSSVDTSIDLTFTYRAPQTFDPPGGLFLSNNAKVQLAGWDLFWVASREAIQNNKRVLNAAGGYVERIYESDDLNLLISNSPGVPEDPGPPVVPAVPPGLWYNA